MANKRLPDNIHRMRGTLIKKRHGDPKTKPQIDPSDMPPPNHLKGDALKEWIRIVGVMEKAKVFTEADRVVLEQYCVLYAEFARLGEEFTAAKHTQLRMCAAELGLTPCARSKITVGSPTGGKKNGDDGFDEF